MSLHNSPDTTIDGGHVDRRSPWSSPLSQERAAGDGRRHDAQRRRGRMRSPVYALLEKLYHTCRTDASGEVASYIPGLAGADADLFGICVATADGHVYEVGDTREPFTIQSISKPFTYGLALEDRGSEVVASKVGVEPSGEAFNSISLAPDSGRPLNPMINAGAIAAASLVAGASLPERYDRVLATYSRYTGRPLSLDEAILASERETGHRNRAIGHMLRTFDILDEDPGPALELYFRQCSIAVNCRDISLMAATLANGGVHPVTGERALTRALVPRVLSVMTTCGMYDAAGNWLDRVGMPAKSGVSGGVLAVLPGQLGVGVFSPSPRRQGNSVRGIEICRRLSQELELHFLRVARPSRSIIRARYDIASVPSKRRRSARESAVLADLGQRGRVFELQGDLLFSGAERVVREIVERSPDLDVIALDLRAAPRISTPAAGLLLTLADCLREKGKRMTFVAAGTHTNFDAARGDRPANEQPPVFADLDAATEWCENRLLADSGVRRAEPEIIELADHALCWGLDDAELAELERLVTRGRYADGDQIVRAGGPAEHIHLLCRGRARKPPAGRLADGLMFGTVARAGRPRGPYACRATPPASSASARSRRSPSK